MLILMDNFYVKKRGPSKENGKRQFRCDEGMVSTLEDEGEISFIKVHGEQGKNDFSATQTRFKTHGPN